MMKICVALRREDRRATKERAWEYRTTTGSALSHKSRSILPLGYLQDPEPSLSRKDFLEVFRERPRRAVLYIHTRVEMEFGVHGWKTCFWNGGFHNGNMGVGWDHIYIYM
jgi:hypothetical protein